MDHWTEAECRTAEALQPKLGFRLACYVARPCARCFGEGFPYAMPLTRVLDEIERTLLRQLYFALGAQMVFRREDGACIRVSTEDLPGLADDVIVSALAALPAEARSFTLIHDYAMQTGSPGAMRLLCTVYADRCDPGDLGVMQRLLNEQPTIP